MKSISLVLALVAVANSPTPSLAACSLAKSDCSVSGTRTLQLEFKKDRVAEQFPGQHRQETKRWPNEGLQLPEGLGVIGTMLGLRQSKDGCSIRPAGDGGSINCRQSW